MTLAKITAPEITATKSTGTFTGVGVGPGPEGMLPIAALQAIQEADIILTPRAKDKQFSVAAQCLKGLSIPQEKIRELVYNMDTDVNSLQEHYALLAAQIIKELQDGLNVVYLTIGDSLTYSTYSYILQSLLRTAPHLEIRTIPGITSYAAIAAALDWPLGQGKETTLILPCPDDEDELKQSIGSHDVIILMKIGHRLPMVMSILEGLDILDYCVFASRLGLDGEIICRELKAFKWQDVDYLSTMLIRKGPFRFAQTGH